MARERLLRRLLALWAAGAAIALMAAAGVGADPGSTGQLLAGAASGPAKAGCTPSGRGRTELVNVSTEGVQADARVLRATVSANGRYVAFSSAATNLVPGDTNGYADVFVRDLRLRTTTRVSVCRRDWRATDRASSRRSAPTAASSLSGRSRGISSRATRTASRTYSFTIG